MKWHAAGRVSAVGRLLWCVAQGLDQRPAGDFVLEHFRQIGVAEFAAGQLGLEESGEGVFLAGELIVVRAVDLPQFVEKFAEPRVDAACR